MPRPCTCDKDECEWCHLYHTSDRHRVFWDGDGTSPLKYPHMGQLIVNVVKQAGQVIAGALQGQDVVVSEERAATRLTICESCPSGVFDKENKKCRQCGCFMDMKTLLESSKCPLGHW